jgi:hypothetical protein
MKPPRVFNGERVHGARAAARSVIAGDELRACELVLKVSAVAVKAFDQRLAGRPDIDVPLAGRAIDIKAFQLYFHHRYAPRYAV